MLTPLQRRLAWFIGCGALAIALIGAAGSYDAVRDLAAAQGFGNFAPVFPLGIDGGIGVLLALDLLLTWLRIPLPLLRHTAWLLTAATIAFNGAVAWPNPLGTAMHAVIPVLFIVTAEAARHAVGRIANITADTHMDRVRLARWLLAPVPTFKLWRRMKLWELRSYDAALQLEQDRLIYETSLEATYGRRWRRTAPVEQLLPLRLAKYGRPLPGPTRMTEPPPPAELPPVATPTPVDASTPPFAQPPAPDPVPAGATHVPAPRAPLTLDLAPMPAARWESVCHEPPPGCDPVSPSDATLITRTIELRNTGTLTLRRLQQEFRIHQRRARRVLDAVPPPTKQLDKISI